MMSNDETSIQAGAVIQGIADMIINVTPDARRAVNMAEVLLCSVVAQCVKPSGVPTYLNQIGESMAPLIPRLRAAYEIDETEH